MLVQPDAVAVGEPHLRVGGQGGIPHQYGALSHGIAHGVPAEQQIGFLTGQSAAQHTGQRAARDHGQTAAVQHQVVVGAVILAAGKAQGRKLGEPAAII